MNISYRSLLILYCINQIKCERSIYGIYHILTGKKSSQTIVDANLYRLSQLFSVLRRLSRQEMQASVDELFTHKLIIEIEKDKYELTTTGSVLLNQQLKEQLIPEKLDGWKYYDVGVVFWKRLSLIVQTVSNLLYEKKDFTTIQQDDDVLRWVKTYLLTKSKRISKSEISKRLYQELVTCLGNLSEKEATVFVLRLSGIDRIGLTSKQIATMLKEEEIRVQLLFLSVVHSILFEIESDNQKFPLLYEISSISGGTSPLTDSTRRTYQLILQGKSIDDIARIRKLKRNTIEDHIVEIVHNMDTFDISSFVSHEHQKEIEDTYQLTKTMRLKTIKEAVGADISYFEIRLILAKSGGKYES